jgi:hypothetical protein
MNKFNEVTTLKSFKATLVSIVASGVAVVSDIQDAIETAAKAYLGDGVDVATSQTGYFDNIVRLLEPMGTGIQNDVRLYIAAMANVQWVVPTDEEAKKGSLAGYRRKTGEKFPVVTPLSYKWSDKKPKAEAAASEVTEQEIIARIENLVKKLGKINSVGEAYSEALAEIIHSKEFMLKVIAIEERKALALSLANNEPIAEAA